jgi:HK97 family phage major capsid protein
MKHADKIIELTKLINARMSELEAMKTKTESEGRRSTEEERARANELIDEVKVLSEELDLEKKELDIRGTVDKSQREPIKPELLNRDEKAEKYPGLPPKELRFSSVGEQLQAIVRADPRNPNFAMDRRLQSTRAATGMGESVPSDGGFLVQQDFSSELLRRLYEESGIVSRVRRIPISATSNSIAINALNETSRASSIWGGIIMYWLGEGSTKIATRPEFRQIELKLKKIAGLYYATDELLQDTAALASIGTQGFAEALDVELERVIIRGTGAGQPLGILPGGVAGAATITVSKETGQLAATVVYENIVKMWARAHARSMGNAIWAISQSVLPQLMTMGMIVGTGGVPVWIPPSGAAASPYGTLLGRPIVPVESCSALGTIGDIILGDFSQYLLATKGGVQTASSIHVQFIYDETVFRIVYRCDGQPSWSSALTPKDSSATTSPFIVLETRS